MMLSTPAKSALLRATSFGLLALTVAGAIAYGVQLQRGMAVTGLSQSVPWGLYIAGFTFSVGVAASSVVVVVPHQLHGHGAFARLLLLAETVSVIAVTQALLFVMVDLGRPARLLNVLLYPSPRSLMFWDVLTLTGYLVLCTTVLLTLLASRGRAEPRWLRGLVLISIPWACAIHVVTALIYAGLVARPAWMTALLAPRFLATAFASGAALLLLLSGALARARLVRASPEANAGLTTIMTYAVVTCLLFGGLELFTAAYSGLPPLHAHLLHALSPEGSGLLPGSQALAAGALIVLLSPRLRARPRLVLLAAAAVFASVLLEKGLLLIPSGFVPDAFGQAPHYRPSAVELLVALGIYAGGALAFLTVCRVFFRAPGADGARPAEAPNAPLAAIPPP